MMLGCPSSISEKPNHVVIANATVGGWLRADRELVIMLHTSYLPWNTWYTSPIVSKRLPRLAGQILAVSNTFHRRVRSGKTVLKRFADLASVSVPFGLSFGTFVCEGLLHFSATHRNLQVWIRLRVQLSASSWSLARAQCRTQRYSAALRRATELPSSSWRRGNTRHRRHPSCSAACSTAGAGRSHAVLLPI